VKKDLVLVALLSLGGMSSCIAAAVDEFSCFDELPSDDEGAGLFPIFDTGIGLAGDGGSAPVGNAAPLAGGFTAFDDDSLLTFTRA